MVAIKTFYWAEQALEYCLAYPSLKFHIEHEFGKFIVYQLDKKGGKADE